MSTSPLVRCYKTDIIMADLLSGIGNLASGVTGALDSIFGWSQKRQQRNQKELMDKQQDQWKEQQNILAQQQLDQWNRENEYNDPSNYYKRLLQGAEANGITKAAALGDQPGGSVGTSAQGVSAPGSPAMTSASGAPMYSIGSGVMAGMRQIAEINNIESQTRKNDAETGNIDANTSLTKKNELYLDVLHRLGEENILSEREKRTASRLERVFKQLQVDNYQKITDAQLRKMYADIRDTNLSADYKEINNRNAQERINVELAQGRSQAQLNLAYVAVQKVLAEKYGVEVVAQLNENKEWQATIDSRILKSVNDASNSSAGVLSEAGRTASDMGRAFARIFGKDFNDSPTGNMANELYDEAMKIINSK